MRTIQLFFNWPEGSVWSNIIASVIWTTPPFIWTIIRFNKKHKQNFEAINKIHKHLGVKNES
jgi:hypothetical protein